MMEDSSIADSTQHPPQSEPIPESIPETTTTTITSPNQEQTSAVEYNQHEVETSTQILSPPSSSPQSDHSDEEQKSSSPKSGSILKFIESNRSQPSRDQGRKRTFTIGSRGTPTIIDQNDNNNNNNNNETTTIPIIITTSTTSSTTATTPSSAFLSTSPSPSTSPNTISSNLLSNHRSTQNSPSSSPTTARKKKVKFERKQQTTKRQYDNDDDNDDQDSKDMIITIGNSNNNGISPDKDNNNKNQIKRDIYGFIVDDFYEELKKFQLQEELMAKHKLEKWTVFNEQYKRVGLCSNPKQLHKLLSQGIPHGIRNTLWKIYSGAAEKQRKEEIELFKLQREEKLKTRLNGMGTIRGLNPPTHRKSYYQHLHQTIRASNRMSTRLQSTAVEIDKDIDRTFPGHPFFESDEGKRKLTRVLQAYSARNRKVGYCQSMNIVAGYILYVVNRNEEDAFWLLSTIVEDYCHNYYSTNLLGAQVDMQVFDHLVKTHLPTLYNHMQSLSVSLSLLSTKWFMCLYIGVLPNEIVFRIWDHLFAECGIYGFHKPAMESKWLEQQSIDNTNGDNSHLNEIHNQPFKCQGLASYNLLLTALAILSYMEENLLKTTSTPQLLTILSTHCKSIFDAKRFFKKYYKWRDRINEDSFVELKKKSEINLIQDLEDMRKLRDLKSTASKITRFSKGELEKIWDGFRNLNLGMGQKSRVSMGKSLKLDFDIFRKVFSYILPNSSETKEVIIQQLFKAFDKNKDGSLDFSELMSGLCILAKGTSEERLQLYFSFFDSDNSGYVTKEEMKLMLQTAYEKIDLDPLGYSQSTIDEYVDIVFSNLGITNNSLSFEDFRQAILSYPRIFKCFMLEEETFTIEDFEILDSDNQQQQQQQNSQPLTQPQQIVNTTATTPTVDKPAPSDVNNNNNSEQNNNHNISDNSNNDNNEKTETLITSECNNNNENINTNDESLTETTTTPVTPTTPTAAVDNNQQQQQQQQQQQHPHQHPLLNNNSTYTKPKSSTTGGTSSSTNTNNSNNKGSSFQSTLIQAIEQAQMEKQSGGTSKHSTVTESTGSGGGSLGNSAGYDSATENTPSDQSTHHSPSSSSNDTNSNSNINNNTNNTTNNNRLSRRMSRAVEPEGAPLSCCKFM